jgi:hypothetical protein
MHALLGMESGYVRTGFWDEFIRGTYTVAKMTEIEIQDLPFGTSAVAGYALGPTVTTLKKPTQRRWTLVFYKTDEQLKRCKIQVGQPVRIVSFEPILPNLIRKQSF